MALFVIGVGVGIVGTLVVVGYLFSNIKVFPA